MRSIPSWVQTVLLLSLGSLGFWACGGDEPPTEERLIAEKFGRLLEAEGDKQGGAVTEKELKTWEAEFTRMQKDYEGEVYDTWKECMNEA